MCWVMPPASPARDVGLADLVEKARLAVVDVTHHGDHRRTRVTRLGLGRSRSFLFATRFGDRLRLALADVFDLPAELARRESWPCRRRASC
jgi:hypothetical protein